MAGSRACGALTLVRGPPGGTPGLGGTRLWKPDLGSVTSSRPSSLPGLARQSHAKGNLVQICLGAVILLLLVGILVEDWHSRKTCPLGRGRAAHRPLPPLPRAQRAPSRGEGPAGWS